MAKFSLLLSAVALLISVWLFATTDTQTADTQISDKAERFMERFLSNPDLYPYLYENKPLPASEQGPEYYRVRIFAEMFIDFAEYIVKTFPRMSDGDAKSWGKYLCSTYNSSAAVRKQFEETHEWYDERLKETWDECPAEN